MTIREERQIEAVEAFLNSDRRSILNCCPRFGKIRVACEIMRNMKVGKVLILAPRKDIFKGWVDDFDKFGYVFFVDFVTFTSIGRIQKQSYDLVIMDEPHELSLNQQIKLKWVVDTYPTLGLTGTMTQKTRDELYDNLGLDVCYKYTIDQGVYEDILSDYQLFIHQVKLDDSRSIYRTKKRSYTERGYFKLYDFIRETANNRRFMELKMINILQNSLAKMEETRRIIKQSVDKRVLVFCGTTKVADKLGIDVYHSKSKERELFLKFCEGRGIDKLATIKMMQAGITINPINRGIINYMSGNPEDGAQKICRFLGLEYNNPDKKAEIHIVTTDEPFELNRLKTGLLFFDQSKIVNLCA